MAGGSNPKNWSTISDPTNTSVTSDKSEQNVNPKDWPTLSDSTNTSSVSTKKEQTKIRSDVQENATGVENIDASTNGNSYGARRKKQPGKTKWSRVPIEMLPYRDNKNERHHNNYEPNRYASNPRNNNGYESANGFANNHENFRGRPYRGGRHSRGNPHRFRRDNNTVSAEPRRYQKVPPETESAPPSVDESTNIEDPATDIKTQVMRQIEYYFSEKNLLKDTYLRLNMDEQGYVQLSLISQFPRIKRLTGDVQLILAAVKKSCYLEVSTDVKVRPVVDPLRWPIKELIEEPIAVNTADPYVDMMTAQLYNMCLDPSAYPHMAVPSTHELPWQYIANGLDKNGVFCPVNVIYPPADSNGLAIVGNADLTNGHAILPEQLDGENPDSYNGVASQYELGDYSDANGKMFDPAEEIPIQLETNGVDNYTDSSNTSNSDESTLDLVSSCNSESNGISSPHTKDIPHKNSTVVGSANGVHDNGTESPDVSIEQEACPSDLRHKVETSDMNGYGQMPNDVIIYNKGGKYYVPPSKEILPEKSDIPRENDSSLLNTSPEPSR